MGKNEIIRPVTNRKYIWVFSKKHARTCGKKPVWIYRDIVQMKKTCHISLNEYVWTGCHALTEEQKESISTLWTRAEFRKQYTDKRYKGILTDKYFFSKVFSEFFRRGSAFSEKITPDELARLSGDTGKVVLKPRCKGQGEGVLVLPTATEQERIATMRQIGSMKNGIVEEYILQHQDVATLNPHAVSIVRFYSIWSPACAYLFAPVLTVACSRDIANGCVDALTAMIDIRSGVVITDGVDQLTSIDYTKHPLTGMPFRGFRIPFWQETVDMMKEVVERAKKISNIGWDVAITETGPLLVEANTIPGFNTAQYRGFHAVTDGYGYQPLFDEAMGKGSLRQPEHYEKVVLKLK